MEIPLRKRPRKEKKSTSKGVRNKKNDDGGDDLPVGGSILKSPPRETREEEDVIANRGLAESTFDESNVSDSEKQLLEEGEKLSGAALKDFLQSKFTDFVEQKMLCISELEEIDV